MQVKQQQEAMAHKLQEISYAQKISQLKKLQDTIEENPELAQSVSEMEQRMAILKHQIEGPLLGKLSH